MNHVRQSDRTLLLLQRISCNLSATTHQHPTRLNAAATYPRNPCIFHRRQQRVLPENLVHCMWEHVSEALVTLQPGEIYNLCEHDHSYVLSSGYFCWHPGELAVAPFRRWRPVRLVVAWGGIPLLLVSWVLPSSMRVR